MAIELISEPVRQCVLRKPLVEPHQHLLSADHPVILRRLSTIV
jgi:hypothetical protein